MPLVCAAVAIAAAVAAVGVHAQATTRGAGGELRSTALTPRYGAVTVEAEDPSYQYRAMPGLQYVRWVDGAGKTQRRFVRSFLASRDGAQPVMSRVQYHDRGAWKPALDAATRKPLMYSTAVKGNYAAVNNTFQSTERRVVALDSQAFIDSGGRYVWRRHSDDGGASWRSTKAYIDMAGAKVLGGAYGHIFQGVIRLPDRSLVTPFYVHHAPGKMAVHLLVSGNEGASWRRAATVFLSNTVNYSESTVARRADGRLIVISRFDVVTGGQLHSKLLSRVSNAPVGNAAQLAGTSWAAARTVKVPGATAEDTAHGVAPVLQTMDRGVLMLAFGRPRNKVTFSYNSGGTWSTAHSFYDNIPTAGCTNGRPAGNGIRFPCEDLGSSGYMGVAVISPRSVYIMGDNCQSWGCDQTKHHYPRGRTDKLWLTNVQLA